MSIVTKTGDKGETSLASGERVSKAHLRVEAYGTLDELVSFLGLAKSSAKNKRISKHIQKIQEDLFSLGTELATISKEPAKRLIEAQLEFIDTLVEEYEPDMRRINDFVIPGESVPSATLDIARSVCRRLERKMADLANSGKFDNEVALKYINRLSDLLFIFARHS